MSSTCSAAEIAEKKRLALEKLRAKKALLTNGVTTAAAKPTPTTSTPASVVQVASKLTSKPIASQNRPQLNNEKVPSKESNPKVNALTVDSKANNVQSINGRLNGITGSVKPTVDDGKASAVQQISGNFYKPSSINSKSSSVAPSPNGENKASAFLSALKQSSMFTHRKEAREASHPYQRPPPDRGITPQKTAQFGVQNNKNQAPTKLAPVFIDSVTCKLYMISAKRFAIHPSRYHPQLVEVLKTIHTKSYDSNTHIWSFDLNDYELLQRSMAGLKPHVVAGIIPKYVINLCRTPVKHIDRSCLASIESTLAEKLMPFQEDGVCFAIAQHGRVMICDEMGLGKTFQALAIADFYKENWPLLICTTASTRESWASHVRSLLPSVPLHYIQVLTNHQQFIGDAKVLITSYNMMEKSLSKLNERKFGVLIFDESHTLKNSKAKCTIVADRLAMMAKNVVLLSGTPALSRPLELFAQLQMVDRKFMSFMDFSSRYCDGKQTHFGWDATGQSNLQELNVVLKLKYMIRRVKADVLPDLAEKSRETVVLDPALIWRNDDTKESLSQFAKNLTASKGREKEEILLQFYAETASVKSRAVCAYIKSLVKENLKFIVFAHHRVMMDAISECLLQAQVRFVRIDGSTRNEQRAECIEEFQKNSACKVAVLSLKACNSGITLTAAEMIVFAELDWNPSTLAQAEGRAHRIGQAKPVVCRYLMATKTADDFIWNMLKAKQDVLNRAGLFAENLQEATHTTAPTNVNKIDRYLSPKAKLHTSARTPASAAAPLEKSEENSGNPPVEIDAKASINSNGSFAKELENLDEFFDDDLDGF